MEATEKVNTIHTTDLHGILVKKISLPAITYSLSYTVRPYTYAINKVKINNLRIQSKGHPIFIATYNVLAFSKK